VGTSGGGELDQNVVESPSDWLQPGISYPKTREKFLVGLEVLPHDLQEQLRPDPDDDTMVIYMIVDAQLSDGTHFSAAQEYKALRKRFGLDADYPSDLHPEPGTLPN